MKSFYCTSLFLLSEVVSSIAAYPSINLDAEVSLNEFKKTPRDLLSHTQNVGGHPLPIELIATLAARSVPTTKEKRTTFNAATQLIDVTGDHVYKAPDFAAGEVRGPCPGLNTLANHNYLPRSGVATLTQYIQAGNEVWGMGVDTLTLLSVYGTVLGGNPLSLSPSFSMGGWSSAYNPENLLDNLGGLIGEPRGLNGTHNTFEVDGSSTRNDLYDGTGNSNDMNMTYFLDLYNLQKDAEVPNYSVDVYFEHNARRFNQSVSTNPYFVYAPFTGWFVRNAAYIFPARMFGNRSEEYPKGLLDKETLKSMYGVYGPEDNMTYLVGQEQIPANWYRRADDYDFVSLCLDLVELSIKTPYLLNIGGNTNGVNTFTGIDFTDVTGGVLNSADLLEKNNMMCFVLEFVRLAAPDSLESLYKTLSPVLTTLTNAVNTPFLSLDCPAFKDLSVNGTDLFSYFKKTYPGAAKSGGAL